MKRYYYLLDGARFLAAFWVMNFHYLFGNGENSQLHWYRYGNLGVQVFFVISGFVIVQSMKGKTLREFATNRFLRLFPLFWVLCTVTYVLTILLPDTRYALHLSDYIRSMTMIGDVLNGIIGPAALIDPSYWTLTVELIFYVGIALFVSIFSHRNIRYFLLAWLLVSAGAFALQIDENFYVKLLLVRHAAYFIFGAALALIASGDGRTSWDRILDRALLVMSAVFATLIHTQSLPAYNTPNPRDAAIISMIHVAIFLGIILLVYLSRFVTSTRLIGALAVLGGLTYPLYLVHQRIGNMLIDLTTGIAPVSWLTLVICFEVIIIGIAYFLYEGDKRFRSWVLSFTP